MCLYLALGVRKKKIFTERIKTRNMRIDRTHKKKRKEMLAKGDVKRIWH